MLEQLDTNERKPFIIKAMKFTLIEEDLFRLCIDGVLRRCIPLIAKVAVIREVHSGDARGHFSSAITYKKIPQARIWWEHMITNVVKFYKSCDICQRVGRPMPANMNP